VVITTPVIQRAAAAASFSARRKRWEFLVTLPLHLSRTGRNWIGAESDRYILKRSDLNDI
jgi:hypothetical protein